jgi:hypothetical protein
LISRHTLRPPVTLAQEPARPFDEELVNSGTHAAHQPSPRGHPDPRRHLRFFPGGQMGAARGRQPPASAAQRTACRARFRRRVLHAAQPRRRTALARRRAMSFSCPHFETHQAASPRSNGGPEGVIPSHAVIAENLLFSARLSTVSPLAHSSAASENPRFKSASFRTAFGLHELRMVRRERPRLHQTPLIRVHLCSSVVTPSRSHSGSHQEPRLF